MGTLGSELQVASGEYSKPPIDTSRSVIGDMLSQTNLFIGWARNQQGERKDKSRGADPMFSWQSARAKAILKDMPTEAIANLSSRIDNYESLRAAVARYKDRQLSAQNVEERFGAAAIPASIGLGLVTDPTTFLGSGIGSAALNTPKIATALHNMSKTQKALAGAAFAGSTAFGYDAAQQAIDMTDNTEQRLFATAFGGTLGGIAGLFASNQSPNIQAGVKGGLTTAIDRTAHLLTAGLNKATKDQARTETNTGKIQAPFGTITSVSGHLHSHENPEVNEFAQKIATPTRALQDSKGNPVVTPNRTAAETKALIERDQTNLEHDLEVMKNTAIKNGELKPEDIKAIDNEVIRHYNKARDDAEQLQFNALKNEERLELEQVAKEEDDRLAKEKEAKSKNELERSFNVSARKADEVAYEYTKRVLTENGITDKEDLRIFNDIASGYNERAQAFPKFIKYLNSKLHRQDSDYVDTGVYYHGSANKITNFDEGHVGKSNIYGDGFYTTTKLDVAKSYTNKDKGTDKTVYRVEELRPIKTLDLETTKADPAMFEHYLDIPKGMTLREAFDELRTISKRERIPKDEMQDLIADIQRQYEAMGYNAWSHQGGKLTGEKGHFVKIYFNPKEDIKLTIVKHEELLANEAKLKAAGAKVKPYTLKDISKEKPKVPGKETPSTTPKAPPLTMEERIAKAPPLKVDYSHANPLIAKMAQRIADYYNLMGTELRSSGMKGLENIKPDGHWARYFDAGKAEASKQEFISSLANSMKRYHYDKLGEVLQDKDLISAATGVYEDVLSNNFFRGTAVKGATNQTKATNKRTLGYYTSDMHDFLKTDINSATTEYSKNISGRLALQKHFGFESTQDFEDYLKDLKKRNPSLDENTFNNMKVAWDTVAGTREVPNSSSFFDHTLRLTAKSSRFVFSPGFVATALAEMANPIMTSGFMNTVEAILPAFKATFDLVKGRPIKDPMVQELMQLNLVGDIVSARQLNRYDSGDTEHNALKGFMGGYEKILDKANHGIHKYLGLGYVTEVAHITATVAATNWLQKLAAKGVASNAGEVKTLARLGYTEEDLKALDKQFKTHSSFNKYGSLTNLNAEAWDKDVMDKLVTGLNREVLSTILQPNGLTLPMWFSDPNSPLARITAQFLRFPVAAHEQLGVRSLDERNANKVIAFVTTASLFAAIGMVKDLNRKEENKQYDLDTEEGQTRLWAYALSNTPQLALGSLLLEKGANTFGTTLTGGKTPGVSGVLLGPAGSMVQGGVQTLESLGDPDKEFEIKNSVNVIAHVLGAKKAQELFLEAIEDE